MQAELKNSIKEGMESEGIEKHNNGKFSVSYITVKSTRLDQKKAIDMLSPEQRKECVIDTESKMFRITELKQK